MKVISAFRNIVTKVATAFLPSDPIELISEVLGIRYAKQILKNGLQLLGIVEDSSEWPIRKTKDVYSATTSFIALLA